MHLILNNIGTWLGLVIFILFLVSCGGRFSDDNNEITEPNHSLDQRFDAFMRFHFGEPSPSKMSNFDTVMYRVSYDNGYTYMAKYDSEEGQVILVNPIVGNGNWVVIIDLIDSSFFLDISESSDDSNPFIIYPPNEILKKYSLPKKYEEYIAALPDEWISLKGRDRFFSARGVESLLNHRHRDTLATRDLIRPILDLYSSTFGFTPVTNKEVIDSVLTEIEIEMDNDPSRSKDAIYSLISPEITKALFFSNTGHHNLFTYKDSRNNLLLIEVHVTYLSHPDWDRVSGDEKKCFYTVIMKFLPNPNRAPYLVE